MENILTTDPYATNRLAVDPFATNSNEVVSVTRMAAAGGKGEVANDLLATNPLAVKTDSDDVKLTPVFTDNDPGSEEAEETMLLPGGIDT
jgi:hypothetical protein